MSPTIVILGCTSVYPHGRHQLATLRAEAARRGVQLLGADRDEDLLAAADLLGELSTVAVPVDDPEACARVLEQYRPDAVLTFREAYVLLTAQVAELLGVRGNDPDAVQTIRHKDRLRARLAASGMPQPASFLVNTVQEAQARVDFRRAARWVVKPRDGSGSVGVSAVENQTELLDAVQGLMPGQPFIVEEFVEGPEYSAEGVFLNGTPHLLGLTEKRTNSAFVEVGHRMPAAGLRHEVADSAAAAVTSALSVSGLTHGVFHVEWWLSGTQVVLGEAHIRPGGDYLHALVAAIRPGLELYGLLMDDLLGVPAEPNLIPPVTRYAGIDFLNLPPGRVEHITGWEQVTALPGLLVADLTVSAGDLVGQIEDSTDRHGCVAVSAASAAEVEETLRQVMQHLTVTTG